MGFQTMGSQGNVQRSHVQPCQLTRQNSWYSLTLNEVENQLENLEKPLGSMNLDELLRSVWSTETNQSIGIDIENTSASSFQCPSEWRGKTVEKIWKEIQQRRKKRVGEEIKSPLGETTLEDFLACAKLFADQSLSPSAEVVSIDAVTPQSFPQGMVLSSSPSAGTLSDTTLSGRKRDPPPPDAFERKLRRKIKNRESAARSRARKQAYHNELVSKVLRLEEENIKHKKEQEFDKKFSSEPPSEPKYQLRRTSSASF